MSLPAEPRFVLRKPLERAIRAGHPWVYRDAVTGDAPAGSVATLLEPNGNFVARGLADAGPIALRVFTTRDEALGPGLIAARVERAADLRTRIVPSETDAYRLLHGEGDRLPGFVCDVYGSFAVLKTDGAGAAEVYPLVADALRGVLAARGVTSLLYRTGGRSKEGAPGPKARVVWGPEPPARLAVREMGMTLLVDLLHGQKTGLFLDQRVSRNRVRGIAGSLQTLNLYGYTGGFSCAAGLGGARSVTTVDVAPAAIALAQETWLANGLDPSRHVAVAADVPAYLATAARDRARFDLIVADPPSFAPRHEALAAALASYRALHAASLAVLRPGGYYLAASCSSHVDRASFESTVLDGARRSGRVLQLLDAWGPPPDHPRPAAFPAGDYLKALLYRAE